MVENTEEMLIRLNQAFLTLLPEVEGIAELQPNGEIIAATFRDLPDSQESFHKTTELLAPITRKITEAPLQTTTDLSIIPLNNRKYYLFPVQNIFLIVIGDTFSTEAPIRLYLNHFRNKLTLLFQDLPPDLEIPPLITEIAGQARKPLPDGEFSCKTIIIGDPQTGKTSLVRRFVDNCFHDTYVSTIGVDISQKKVELSDSCKINMALWDIGAQSTMQPLWKRFYQGASAAIFLFDVTNRASFEHLKTWDADIKANLAETIPCLLIANKIDLPDQQVTLAEIQQQAETLQCPFLQVSAKTGVHVTDVFFYAAYKYIRKIDPQK